MKVLLISVVLLQAWCNALPKPNGVATYTYQDPSGKSDNLGRIKRRLPFGRAKALRNRMFGSDVKSQRLALHAAKQAFDLSYNSGGYNPTFSRFPFGGFPFGGFGAFNMDRLSHNSAFSSAGIGPGYTQQSAIINPPNAAIPNVDITDRFAEPEDGPGKFYSVSSSSFASSNNDNGKVSGFRGAETVVNNNGKVTKYRVHS